MDKKILRREARKSQKIEREEVQEEEKLAEGEAEKVEEKKVLNPNKFFKVKKWNLKMHHLFTNLYLKLYLKSYIEYL